VGKFSRKMAKNATDRDPGEVAGSGVAASFRLGKSPTGEILMAFPHEGSDIVMQLSRDAALQMGHGLLRLATDDKAPETLPAPTDVH
jgi:hypothetical protein